MFIEEKKKWNTCHYFDSNNNGKKYSNIIILEDITTYVNIHLMQ